MKKWFYILASVALLAGCKPDEQAVNVAPETQIFVDAINLTGVDRLSSEVSLHWYGSDEDGYVTGFEMSFDGSNWFYTDRTDSTFNFEITIGSDTMDIDFYVRAIDNGGLTDETPAYLRVPIRNSPPTAVFDSTIAVPDTSLFITTLFFSVSDPDGADNIDSVALKINGGSWYNLPKGTASVTIRPTDPTATGTVSAEVYRGGEAILMSLPIDGLELNGENTFYLRALDFAGEYSEIDTSKTFFMRNRTGDLLVVDTYGGTTSPTPESIYLPILDVVEGNYDYIDLAVNANANIPQLWNPTFYFVMQEYDRIFWYSDALLYNNELYLESAASVVQQYLFDGGKLLVSMPFPTDFDNANSSILGFAPIDSLSTSDGQARIQTDAKVSPESGFAATYDTLRASSFITGADPFYIKQGAEVMYRADITPVSGWVGPDVVVGAIRNSQNNINQVFCSVELHRMNNDPAALQDFFNEVLQNAFSW